MALAGQMACTRHYITQGQKFNTEKLRFIIDTFFNRNKKQVYFTDFIDEFIKTAPTRKNKKGGYGLSESSIYKLHSFKKIVEKYQNEVLKRPLTIDEITNQTALNFRDHFLKSGYSLNSTGNNLTTFKKICNYIKDNDININIKLEKIETIKERKETENIITLSIDELKQIKELDGLQPYLINVRAWLLLGCEIGQRAGDLLELSEKNIIEIDGVQVFKLKQQKTGKEIYIPITPRAKEVLNAGFPYKISMTAFNAYIKILCRKANINEIVKGRKARTETTESQLIEGQKWEFISSHVCRRSFASNYYGKIPTSTIKAITGHTTEEMLLKYIGKTAYDHAKEMIQSFKLLSE